MPHSLSRDLTLALCSIFPRGIVALDFETTGISPLGDKIIEVAAVKIKPDAPIEIFESLVNPQKRISEQNFAIHNISNEMIEHAPLIGEVLPKFTRFLESLPIIAHNAKFDIGFLVMALHDLKMPFSPSQIFDSCKLARYTHKEATNHKLKTLIEHLNLPAIENHHRALDDSWACLNIFAHGIQKLQESDALSTLKEKAYLFSIDDFSPQKSFDIPAHLKPLLQLMQKENGVALGQGPVIEIIYKGGTTPGGPRKIVPLSFLPMPLGSVLQAHCLESDQIKTYSLRKVRSYKVLAETREEYN
ncbi:MAG: exonuclease domain-containing protein [Bacteriovoracaceae bacterium]